MIGRTLNQCKILSKLGSGGMGEVYVAEDLRLERRVALKTLPGEMARDPDRRMRFEREAKAIAALNHPNIVTIYSVEDAEDTTFITMELVHGQSLNALIQQGGLPLGRFFELARSLTDAVGAAHAKGITHRDLKPDNIMYNEEGRLKILDFGLAKLRDETPPPADGTQIPTTAETQAGMILGTASYMSPEQAQGHPVDHRTDIFSLGIILYEMATGVRPFRGGNQISVISSILKDQPTPVTEVRPGLPPALAEILQRALEKDPDRRYASVTDLRDDLERLRQQVDTGEPLASGAVARPPASRPRWLVPVLGLGVLALVAAVAVPALRLLPLRGESASAPVAAALADGRPSLAVFYFENITGDPALEWLRTGLTDMLVTDLSQSPGVRVLDTGRLYQILESLGSLDERQTSFETVRAVADQAGISTALTGSYVRAGSTIRISARLQDTDSGEILTSERVEGEGEESIFAIVDDLTRRIKTRLDLAAETTDADRDLRDVTTDSVEAYRYYAEGIRLHERLKEKEALPFLEKAVETDPDFAMALAKLSVVHQNLEHHEEAREYAKRALDLVDRLSARERYYIEGRYYSLRSETVERAIEAYEKAVELFPDHSSARNNLAQQLMALRRWDEAIHHFEELRRRGMTFPATYASLATAYASVGRPEDGYRVLQEYRERNPANAAGLRSLAGFAMTLGRFDEALEAIATAEQLEPDSLEGQFTRWGVHVLREQWDEARAAAEKMFEASSPYLRWGGGSCLAVTALYRGDLERALDLVEGGIGLLGETSVQGSQARMFRSAILYEAGDYERAIEVARRTIALAADRPEFAVQGHYIAGMSLARLGRDAEVDAEIAALGNTMQSLPAEALAPFEPWFLGEIALARGDAAEAARKLRRAIELMPHPGGKMGGDHGRVWHALGRAHLEAGRLEEAETWFRRVVDAGAARLFDPAPYVRSHYFLAKIAEQRGNQDRARRHFRRFLDHWGEGQIDRERVEEARRVVGL